MVVQQSHRRGVAAILSTGSAVSIALWEDIDLCFGLLNDPSSLVKSPGPAWIIYHRWEGHVVCCPQNDSGYIKERAAKHITRV